MQEQFKNNLNKEKLLNMLEDIVVTSLLVNGLLFQIYKQLRTKQDLNKIIKTKTLINSKKFILKKIYYKKKCSKKKDGFCRYKKQNSICLLVK